jgi:hypothetical protein
MSNSEYIINKYLIGKNSTVQFKNDPATYYVKNISPDRNSLFVTLNGMQTYNKKIINLVKVDGKVVIKENIKNIIKEIISQQNIQSKKLCNCGCGGCDANNTNIQLSLNEDKIPRSTISEGLNWYITKQKPLTEQLYRAGSQKYFDLWKEARALYSRNLLEIQNLNDLEIITETNLGEFGIIYEIEIGDKVVADKEYGGAKGEVVDIRGSFIVVKTKEGNESYHESDLKILNKEGKKVPLDFPMLDEAEYDFNINKIWDFIESRPFNNPNYMPKFSIAKEIWDEWGDEEKQLYNNFQWEDKYNGQLHRKEIANLQRRKNYDSLAGINEAEFKLLKNGDKYLGYSASEQIYYVKDFKTGRKIKYTENAMAQLYGSDWKEQIDESKNESFKKGDTVYDKHTKAKLKVTRIVKDRIYTVPFNFPGRAEEWYKAEDLQTKSFFTESKNENKPLNKPMRDSSGGKAYKVYVRDPKTKKIKTVRFGSGGLRAKLDNPKARKAFAARHKCGQGEEKTSPKWWSCRIGRYSKLLGFKSNFTGFW